MMSRHLFSMTRSMDPATNTMTKTKTIMTMKTQDTEKVEKVEKVEKAEKAEKAEKTTMWLQKDP